MKIRNVLCAFFMMSSIAHAADCGSERQSLNLAYPAQSALTAPVDVQFHLDGDNLVAQFEVRAETINAKPVLGPNEYPYQADVVELFVSVAGNAEPLPYYEFELSPYGNTFEVRVDSLKKRFAEGLHMGLQHQVIRSDKGWQATLVIPLRNLGWSGDVAAIRGNAYSILGKSPNRSFWSLYLPQQTKPNFHKPEFFKTLLQCVPEN